MEKVLKGGYIGKVLKVDLTDKRTEVVSLPHKVIEEYLGGEGIGSRLLYDMAPTGIDPLHPHNPIFFFTGPLTGTRAPGGNLSTVVSKSPVTRGIGGSDAQGFFGTELKAAGYDGIIIEGASEHPVFLLITNDTVKINDATTFWGLDAYETEEAIIRETGISRLKIVRIGQAGENLSSMAGVLHDNGHMAGRFGLGAIMGSKKLKGIAVRGRANVPMFNREEFDEVRKQWKNLVKDFIMDETLTPYGTAGFIPHWATLGDPPVKNWVEDPGAWEEQYKLSGQFMHQVMEMKNFASCHSCPFGGHRKTVTIQDGPYAGSYLVEPEYETVQSIAGMAKNSDPAFAVKAGDLCNRYGLDSISTGTTIAFAIECFERGLITKEDTDGIELRFGNNNSEAILSLIRKIAYGEGFGRVLMHDVKMASDAIGRGSEDFAMHSGNISMYMHDPRAGFGSGLGAAVSTVSGDGVAILGLQWGGIDPELGFPSALNRHSPDRQAFATITQQDKQMVFDSIGLCHFVCTGAPLALILKAFWMATGWNLAVHEAIEIGERIVNLRRAYNVREGIAKGDDRLPKRLLQEAHSTGGSKGKTVPLDTMLADYYRLRGWDRKTGKPLKATLERLNLDDVARDLW